MTTKVSEGLLEEAAPIIQRLARIRRKNGGFAYYEKDDISQEVWALCLDALDRYDVDIGPLENYLVRHVSNRLKNLKRDRYFRPGCDVATSGHAFVRISLVNALPLDDGFGADSGRVFCSSPISNDPVDHMLHDETVEYIRERLPDHLVVPFDDLIGNNRVRKAILEEMRAEIAAILIGRDDDESV